MITKPLSSMTWLAVLFLLSGCHYIQANYPGFLAGNRATPPLTHVALKADYVFDYDTSVHRSEIRSILAGYGNKWVVEYGAMLDQTLQSVEVQSAFTQLKRGTADGHPENLLTFELLDYDMNDFAVNLMMRVRWTQGRRVILDEIYGADGRTQVVRVLLGGAFTMRRAVQASTKQATDQVLRAFMHDVARILDG